MRPLTILAPLLAIGAAAPSPLLAQTPPGATAPLRMVQALPGTTEADRLADAVRRLGDAPRDLSALIEAGELSLRLGDATAASAFFKRAENVDPNNGRVKAGIARLLVTGEHPGDALRYFDQATRAGLPATAIAADRGLAYDLIGEQERAQRDYRTALRSADADETRRRYALSLGIAGRKDEALAQIDTLVRRSDRGAWRARAFILAMNGDVPGAQRIATSMMPRGMSAGLAPFFARLATLSPADRAFAVHFGEISPTPERLADARLAPPLPALGPDPDAPVQVAAVAPTKNDSRDRRRGRDRSRGRQVVAATAAPVATPAPQPSGAVQVASTASAPTSPLPQTSTAARVAPVAPVTSPATVTAQLPPQATAPIAAPSLASTPAPAASVGPTPPASQVAAAAPIAATTPAVTVAAVPSTSTSSPADNTPSALAAASAPPASTPAPLTPEAPAAAAQAQPSAAPPEALAATPTPTRLSEDTILARIVAGIGVPGSELGIAPPPSAAPATTPDTVAPSAEPVQRVAAAEPAAAPTATRAQAPATRRTVTKKAETADTPAGKKAPVEKKGAKTAAKADADKPDKTKAKADKPDPAPAGNVWVQVAGGANADDLHKAWSAAQAKAPALAGRQGFTTPLRATNRVVTGPFKTEAEAQALVNKLAGQGVQAFTFTSAKGQKLTPVKK